MKGVILVLWAVVSGLLLFCGEICTKEIYIGVSVIMAAEYIEAEIDSKFGRKRNGDLGQKDGECSGRSVVWELLQERERQRRKRLLYPAQQVSLLAHGEIPKVPGLLQRPV